LVCLVLLLVLLHEDLYGAKRGEHHSNGRTVMAPAGAGELVGGGGSNTAFTRPGRARAWTLEGHQRMGPGLDGWVRLRSYWWTLRWLDGGMDGWTDGRMGVYLVWRTAACILFCMGTGSVSCLAFLSLSSGCSV